MRLSQAPPLTQLLSLLLLTFSHTSPVSAGPYPKDALHDLGFSYLMDRSCASYCGADNQYCCTTGQACYTNSENIAYCSASSNGGSGGGSGGGGYVVFTTVYTKTGLLAATSVYTSFYPGTTPKPGTGAGTGAGAVICDTSLGQTSCGTICCADDQMCEYAGQCTARTSLWSYTYTATGAYSAPLRPTSGPGTSKPFVSATTTQPFTPPATASGGTLPIAGASSSNLSGGAIAGIVIGTIAGVILLLLLCFCCLVRGLWDGVFALLGGRSRRQTGGTRTERIETIERYSRRGSTVGGAAAARREHSGWFGGARTERPTRVVETRKKQSSGLGGMGAVGAGLVGLAVVLGLKKKEDERDEKRRPGPMTTVTDISSTSYTSYTDSYTGTSASSESSDRRTRDERRDRSTRR
ncbi:hypothetical protein DSL72_004380 [Monilinia vaccinii-corymbosi]|uniref:Mid2 domain-containing protein n=1 Tax=Monilinia vaccinii-corymbosi TaxID=61207 RepID=A0A8A3NZ42_9HELO|nr:hypothetical protein DSL72_004380 [Monilinia vaccinii-corymbosi]